MIVKCDKCQMTATVTPTSKSSYETKFNYPSNFCKEIKERLKSGEIVRGAPCKAMDEAASRAFAKWQE